MPAFVPALALTLVISWGSLYYAFALLAPPMRADLGTSTEALMSAYSLGLLVWGLATGGIGALLQRCGGRVVMSAGSLLAGLMFIALGRVESVAACHAVWASLGLAMALVLYEPAFAVIVQACPADRRRFITLLTLAGGFASAVFWPLTDHLVHTLGWRGTAMVLAALQLGVCAPLHAGLLPRGAASRPAAPAAGAGAAPTAAVDAAPAPPDQPSGNPPRRRVLGLLAAAFAVNGFITAALAMHVITLLQARGAAPQTAVLLAAGIGPMQVLGRALEYGSGQALDARRLGLLALALVPLALVALWLAAWAPLLCGLFVAAYGAGLGLSTIVRATTPLALFGPARYAVLSGALGAPALVARAAGPLGAAWLLARWPDAGMVLLLLAAAAMLALAAYAKAWTLGNRVST